MMALKLSDYNSNETFDRNKAHGDLGEKAVCQRLKSGGWRIDRCSNSLVDYNAYLYDKNGNLIRRELIEVKSRKAFHYDNCNVNALTLEFDRCDSYDDYVKNTRLPMILYWVDFRNGEIYRKNFSELLQPTVVNDKKFPAVIKIDGKHFLTFARECFDFWDTLTDGEINDFYKLYPEER